MSEELRQREWQPIETAPRDGSAVLVMRDSWPGTASGRAEECNGHNTYVAEWWQGENGGAGAWICYMDAVHDPACPVEPTHWMSLPKPPRASRATPPSPSTAQQCTCPSGDGSLRWRCPEHPPSTASEVGELPPLPKPDKWWREDFGLGDSTVHEGHSDDQMRAYGQECARAALAAKTKDTTQPLCDSALRAEPAGQQGADLAALACAIRAMAPAHGRGSFGKQSDYDHYTEGHEHARIAAADLVVELATRSRAEGGNTQPSTGEVDGEAAFEAWFAEHDDANKCCHEAFKDGFIAARSGK